MNSLTVDRTEKTQIGAMAALVGVQITFGSLPVIAKVVLAVVPAVALRRIPRWRNSGHPGPGSGIPTPFLAARAFGLPSFCDPQPLWCHI